MRSRSVRIATPLADDAVYHMVAYAYALDPQMTSKFDNIKIVVNNLRGSCTGPLLGLEDDERSPNIIWVKWKFDDGRRTDIMVSVSQAISQKDDVQFWPKRWGSRMVEKGKRMVETFGLRDDEPVGATLQVQHAVIGMSAKQIWPEECSP